MAKQKLFRISLLTLEGTKNLRSLRTLSAKITQPSIEHPDVVYGDIAADGEYHAAENEIVIRGTLQGDIKASLEMFILGYATYIEGVEQKGQRVSPEEHARNVGLVGALIVNSFVQGRIAINKGQIVSTTELIEQLGPPKKMASFKVGDLVFVPYQKQKRQARVTHRGKTGYDVVVLYYGHGGWEETPVKNVPFKDVTETYNG